ncbi:MAG: amidohydrolase [Acidobacteria bacterium]|nr:amidohydrolase [Acidobacteriota bacterium]
MTDLVFCNANIITMDPLRPRASLAAIVGNRIVSVGGRESLESLKAKAARIVDCAGYTLLPGFVDAHCHIHAFAESLVSLNLSSRGQIRSIADIQSRMRDYCKNRPPGAWIRGKGYNEFYLAEKRHPNRRDLDAAAPMNPVKLTHRSGHAHVLNSLALKQVGITEETGDPPRGFIDRDPETGLPTGILYGMGEYLANKVPFMDDGEIEQGLMLADKKLLACGITSVQDASSENGLHQWNRLKSWKARGLFHPRLTMMIGLNAFVEAQQDLFVSEADCTDLRPGGVKIIVSRTTGNLEPVQEELNAMLTAVHTAGLQVAIHAIEEPEIEAACNAIECALSRFPRGNHRHRIEHCSVCTPSMMKRLAACGITVVTQPSFIYFSGDRYLKTVSGDQLEHLYPIGSMFNSGLNLAFGSDFPISDPNPMIGIYAAVTRMTEDKDAVLPKQRIPVADALHMYTLGAAAVGFEDGIKGSISPGKLADLVMLSEDPCRVDPSRIKDIKVLMTVLNGRIVWSDDGIAPEFPRLDGL